MKAFVLFGFFFSLGLAFEAPMYPQAHERRSGIQNGRVERGYDNGYRDTRYEYKNYDKNDDSDSRRHSHSHSKSSSDSHEHHRDHHECPEPTTQEPATCAPQVRPTEACPIGDRVGEVPLFVANGAVATTGIIAFLLGLNQKRASYLCDGNEGSLQFFEPFRINDLLKKKKRGLESLIFKYLYPKDTFSYGFNSNSCTNLCIRDEGDVYWTPSNWRSNGFDFAEELGGLRANRVKRASKKKKVKKAKKAKILNGPTPTPKSGATTHPTPVVPAGDPSQPLAQTQTTPRPVTPRPAGNPLAPPPPPASTPAGPPVPIPANEPLVPGQSTPKPVLKPAADNVQPSPSSDDPAPAPVPPTSQAAIQAVAPDLIQEHVGTFGGLHKFIEGYIIPYCNGDICHQFLLLTPWSGSLIGRIDNGTLVGKYNNLCLYEELIQDTENLIDRAADAPPDFAAANGERAGGPILSYTDVQASQSVIQFQSGIGSFQEGNDIFGTGGVGGSGCEFLKVKAISCHGCGPIKGDAVNQVFKQTF